MNKITFTLPCLLTLTSSLLTVSSAQSAPKFPPPVKGEYGCIQIGVGLGVEMRDNSGGLISGGSNAGGFNTNYSALQTQAQPSGLKTIVIDGKGNYTVTGLKAKGAYTFDAKTNTLKYTGPLAKLEGPGYFVGSDGTFSISFDLGGARNYCEVKVKGNPLPAQKNPNGNLPGTLVLSHQNGASEFIATDGKFLEDVKAPLGARDAKGRFTYILLKGTGHNEVVVEDKAGKRIGGYPFYGFGINDGRYSYPTLSPDGTRVAVFLKCPQDPWSDCLAVTGLQAKGEEAPVLSSTPNVTYDGGPAAWTGDGRILYSGKDKRLYISDSSFGNEKRLTEREGRFPAVSPDGKKVAYVSGNAVYTINLDGSSVKKVVYGDASQSLHSPAWSPDGKYLLSIVKGSGYAANLWLNPLEGNKEGYYLTDAFGQKLDASGIQRLSWWSGK